MPYRSIHHMWQGHDSALEAIEGRWYRRYYRCHTGHCSGGGYCIERPCIVSSPGKSIELLADQRCAIATDNEPPPAKLVYFSLFSRLTGVVGLPIMHLLEIGAQISRASGVSAEGPVTVEEALMRGGAVW